MAAAVARAQPAQPPPAPPPSKPVAEKPPPLSKEDAELVKQLALLERLDLVRNLDLFEADKDRPPPDAPTSQRK
ncbi:MAG TPA: hypothetical protein VLW85_12780 [Myxococcales bacterium]|nr:hypothetical protein [Myxococcales bacterium]